MSGSVLLLPYSLLCLEDKVSALSGLYAACGALGQGSRGLLQHHLHEPYMLAKSYTGRFFVFLTVLLMGAFGR